AVLGLAHFGERVEQPIAAPDQEPDHQDGGRVGAHAVAIILGVVGRPRILVDALDRRMADRRKRRARPPRPSPRFEPQNAAHLLAVGRLLSLFRVVCSHESRPPPSRYRIAFLRRSVRSRRPRPCDLTRRAGAWGRADPSTPKARTGRLRVALITHLARMDMMTSFARMERSRPPPLIVKFI